MTETNIAPLPCPHCGEKLSRDKRGMGWYWIHPITECPHLGYYFNVQDDDSLANWNRRALCRSDALVKELEQLAIKCESDFSVADEGTGEGRLIEFADALRALLSKHRKGT